MTNNKQPLHNFLAHKKTYYALVFLLCIISRIVTSIFYVEDIDSLRFALSIYDYDLNKIQPHFPGYPIFCFLVKLLYFFTGSISHSFSLIGGLSTYLIILFCSKIFSIKLNSSSGVFLSSVIFFNPIIWLMGNRYMPDLFGLAITTIILCLLIRYNNSISSIYTGFFLSGALLGIRLSYFPMVIFILIYTLTRKKDIRPISILSFFLGVAIWLIPLISLTGFENFMIIAKNHTLGHFYDYGGSIITDNDLNKRVIRLIESIWSDGMAGYWIGRSWKTLIISFFLILLLLIGLYETIKNIKFEKSLKLIFLCTLLYLLWIFLFQNIIYKSRHILPILLFIFLILNHGYEYFLEKNKSIAKISLFVFIIFLSQLTFRLNYQHKNFTAIAKLKNYIEGNSNISTILSTPLINNYLKSNRIKKNFVNLTEINEVENFIKSEEKSSSLMIGSFQNVLDNEFDFTKDSVFYHNPYMNRSWAVIETFQIMRK